MTNYHILNISFIGSTDRRPARVKIKSDRFKQSVIVQFDYEFDTVGTALNWLQSQEFEIVGKGEGKDSYYLISTTFKPLDEKKCKGRI